VSVLINLRKSRRVMSVRLAREAEPGRLFPDSAVAAVRS